MADFLPVPSQTRLVNKKFITLLEMFRKNASPMFFQSVIVQKQSRTGKTLIYSTSSAQ